VRKRTVAVGLLFVEAVAVIIFLELGLRVYSAIASQKMMTLDDTLGWKHSPAVSKLYRDELGDSAPMTFNASGMRGPQRSTSKPPGLRRILVLGDSFTEGANIAENDLLTARLEQNIPQTEVLNAGVGGYSTVQEYVYLAETGILFQPDLVLLMFYENDLAENTMSFYPGFGPRPYATFTGGQLRLVRDLDPTKFVRYILPVPFSLVLNRHSYLYYALNRYYQRLRAVELTRRERLDASEVDRATQYQIFFALVEETRKLLDARGIDLLVALIPSTLDIDAGVSQTDPSILAFCAEKGIACVSLFDRLRRESAAGTRVFYPVDTHWTKFGHQAGADEIARHLQASWVAEQ
jgi:hypothetical protein